MDPTSALLAGLATGLAVAVQFGAVSVLLVDTAVASGPRVGAAAGMGVATADLGFAAVAAAAGGTVGAVLASHESEIRIVAAVVLAAIAVHGLAGLRHRAARAAPGTRRPGARGAVRHYGRFLAITAANPLTIASFATVAASLTLRGPAAAAAFAAGVGVASAAWHLVLSVAAGHAGRRLPSRASVGLAVAGRVAVLALAVNLALAA